MPVGMAAWNLLAWRGAGWEAGSGGWEAGTVSAFLRRCWESVLSSFGGSRSMIHQKVLWECTGVSGFLNYQLAIPGPGICQTSLSSPGVSSSPRYCCSDRAGGVLLKAVFVVLF